MPPRKADPPPEPAKKPRKRKRKVSIFPKFQNHPVAGRPRTYEPAYCPRAHKLALLGLTDVEIAEQFGINPLTLYRWKDDHPEFCKAIDDGKTPFDAEVAYSMGRRALGFEHPAVKIFAPTTPGAEPIYAPYMEYYPPDVGAQKSWLFNRQPDRWRERKQVEHIGSLEHRISLMSPEDRLARLKELQAKAQLVIEGEASEVKE